MHFFENNRNAAEYVGNYDENDYHTGEKAAQQRHQPPHPWH